MCEISAIKHPHSYIVIHCSIYHLSGSTNVKYFIAVWWAVKLQLRLDCSRDRLFMHYKMSVQLQHSSIICVSCTGTSLSYYTYLHCIPKHTYIQGIWNESIHYLLIGSIVSKTLNGSLRSEAGLKGGGCIDSLAM